MVDQPHENYGEQILEHYNKLCITSGQKEIFNECKVLINTGLLNIKNNPELLHNVGTTINADIFTMVDKLENLRSIPNADNAYLPLFRAMRLLCTI